MMNKSGQGGIADTLTVNLAIYRTFSFYIISSISISKSSIANIFKFDN
jgi:hypothetical protein